MLPLVALLVALLATAATVALSARALRRVDVAVICAAPLLRRRCSRGAAAEDAPQTMAAAAARRYAARLVGGGGGGRDPGLDDIQQLFSLPGPSPALAPFVLAGCLRGAATGPALFCNLLFGGARQMVPTAAEGQEGGKTAADAAGAADRPCWLAGTIAVAAAAAKGQQQVGGAAAEVVGVRAVAPPSSFSWAATRWFRDVDARVVFEREEKEAEAGAAREGGKGGEATAAMAVVVLRARCEATVRGVPAFLQGATRAAVEQAHGRLCRDVATDLMQPAAEADQGRQRRPS